MRITVHVKPNASEEKLEKLDENRYKVWVKEKPKRNKANFAVAELLAKHFQVPLSSIKLLGGGNSRQKTFNISK